MNESLKELISHIELPSDQLKDQDPEIREIFIEEVQEIIEFLESALPQWIDKPADRALLSDIRRSFHTLKGSGRMAGAVASAELAWSIEDLLNGTLEGTTVLNLNIQHLVYSVAILYKSFLNDFEVVQPHQIDIRPWIVSAQSLKNAKPLECLLQFTVDYYKIQHIPEQFVEQENVSEEKQVVNESMTEICEANFDIFLEEGAEHLHNIAGFLNIQGEPSVDALNQLIRAVHTIRGSSGMMHIDALFAASSQVENVFKHIDASYYAESTAEKNLLLDYHDYVKTYLDLLTDNIKHPKLAQLEQQFAQAWQTYIDHSGEPVHLNTQGIVAELLALDINELLDAEFAFIEEVENNLADYLALLLQQVDVLQTHTIAHKQTQSLHRISVLLQHCYQALLDKVDLDIPSPLIENIQALHQHLIDAFDGLASGQNIIITSSIEDTFESVLNDIQALQLPDELLSTNLDSSTLLPEQAVFDSPASIENNPKQQIQLKETHFDEELLAIFIDEADELVGQIDAEFPEWENEPDNVAILNHLFRYLHTLKGGANMIQATHLGEIIHELESIYSQILLGDLIPTDEIFSLIRYTQDDIALRIQRLRDERADEADLDLLADLRAVVAGNISLDSLNIFNKHVENSQALSSVDPEQSFEIEPLNDVVLPEEELITSIPEQKTEKHVNHFDQELLAIFLEESDEIIIGMDTDFNTWEAEPNNIHVLHNLLRYLHTLKGGANMVQATHLGEIAHELESIYERTLNGLIQPSIVAMQLIRSAQDDIATRIQLLRNSAIDEPNPELIEQLRGIAQGQENLTISEQPEPEQYVELVLSERQKDTPLFVENKKPFIEELSVDDTYAEQEINVVEPIIVNSHTESDIESTIPEEQLFSQDDIVGLPPILIRAQQSRDETRIIIVESYLEEAEELLDHAEHTFTQWQADRSNRNIMLILQRAFHTLKGNSRLVEEEDIASIAYQLEFAFEQFSLYSFTSSRYDRLIQNAINWLRKAIFLGNFTRFDELLSQFTAIQYEETLINDDIVPVENSVTFDNFEQIVFVEGDGSTPPAMYEVIEQKQEQHAQEQIRISADLVEKMIDLSGENAINRSRIELDLGQITYTLSEMELAIHRLADQLRRMEGELEVQILAKHDVDGSKYLDFDPLEMDQYSSLNQLSKSLSESASDLIDFKSTLSEKIRDTENLLLQQSRIQNELQQALMGTRLVPFSRLIPRLQRLVRQTSAQLSRDVELNIENTEGELDRNILERLVSPLEHMLRNAIDHGIEDHDTRLQLGKPTTGNINLNIAREGNDILVIFKDDGHGIDVDAVKTKAVQNGLIASDTHISDFDIMQLIFHPGLSTAKKITQISGRGVGLDVVQSEIKSLGGHLSVNSEHGKGTEFTIRVPTSVAISDALMVKVGEQQYALPLAQIERIVRISPVALAEYYESNREEFLLDNQKYRLRYIGEFISGQPKPLLNNLGSSVPVVIFNSGGRSVALQVDQLVGSRAQIVIKPIGKQLSSVGHIGGATILADGRVCLILDGQSIARSVLTTIRTQFVEKVRQQPIEQKISRQLILVVDDSVTVRKVTSRLLDRQGFDVITAKDGVEAVEKLAQITPDLMLLDIEMPRMDGFEVANYVRHHEKHHNLPMIMITSRTGEKHREHAFSLGVNAYMGKPFQEKELLKKINELLDIVTTN